MPVKRWVVWMHAWYHQSVLDRRKDIESKLQELSGLRLATLTHVPGQDADQMAAAFARVENAGLLYQIGFDPNAIGGLLDALLQAGVEPEKMVKVNQGYKLAGSIRTAERKLWEGVLVHDGNELGNWVVGNAKVVTKGNGLYITKQVSGSAKIDPLIAMLNCVDIMQLNPEAMNDDFDVSKMVIAG
jgi:phage terminase large subunit-like protein